MSSRWSQRRHLIMTDEKKYMLFNRCMHQKGITKCAKAVSMWIQAFGTDLRTVHCAVLLLTNWVMQIVAKIMMRCHTSSEDEDSKFINFYDHPDECLGSKWTKSEIDSRFDEDDIKEFLSSWAVEFVITQNILSALLRGLPKGLPELLKDALTWLSLNIDVEHKNCILWTISSFWHCRKLKKVEEKVWSKWNFKNAGQYWWVSIVMQLWPILGILKALGSAFIIGAFVGKSKPNKCCM